MRLVVLSRHAHSTLNLAGRINGDPTVEVTLTEEGRAEAERLGTQVWSVPLGLVVHTRFGRTRFGSMRGRSAGATPARSRIERNSSKMQSRMCSTSGTMFGSTVIVNPNSCA